MKRWNASARKVACRAVFALGCFVCIQLTGARDARAETSRKVEGFEVLGTLGYGVDVGGMTWWDREVDPYGVMVGLDLGYTFPFGLRIGVEASKGFGRRIEQTLSTGEVVTTDTSSFPLGGSVGYDLLFSSFRLRGAVDSGFIFYSGENAIAPGGGFYIGPKVALIWQYRAFELGLQSKYWAATAGGVVQMGLMSGARF
ncbi:MAG: hypothetical protein WDO74_06960 [Pseudomonadota bacterium]